MARFEWTPDGRYVLVMDLTECAGCGQPFGLRLNPGWRAGWQQCSCTPGSRGHHEALCNGCGTMHLEPPCRRPGRPPDIGSSHGLPPGSDQPHPTPRGDPWAGRERPRGRCR